MLRRGLLATLLLVAAVGVACGNDDKKDAATATTKASTPPPVFTIKATDTLASKSFKYELPAGIKGGPVTLRLQNDGKGLHDFQLAKVVPGHTLAELLKQVVSDDAPLTDWVVPAGGVGTTKPGATNEATLDLPPGKYWYFCTESEDGPTEDAPGIAHADHGMAGELEIVGASGADFPTSAATIEASEYTFKLNGLKAGSNTVTFTNAGQQIHHALLIPINAGKTFADAKAFFTTEGPPTGQPPIDFENAIGTEVLNSGGDKEFVTFDLKPATTYALICFMPDRGTAGPPHVAKGMSVEVKIP